MIRDEEKHEGKDTRPATPSAPGEKDDEKRKEKKRKKTTMFRALPLCPYNASSFD